MPRSKLARFSAKFFACVGVAALLLAALTGSAAARDSRAGIFDHFVLSLSWSPTYCADEGDGRDPRQCAPGRRFAFVVHGLWPQYRDGGWPEYCATDETWVPQDVIDEMMPVMPSKRLIIHQWKKHGSCTGLSLEDYFTATRLLFEKLRIPARYLSPTAAVRTSPEQLVSDFVKTNANLSADMMTVHCGNARDQARLSELRVCIDRRGNFGQCGANSSGQCRARTLVLPPVK